MIPARSGGLQSQFSPFRYFPNLSALSKHTVDIEYHVYIWQVLPQLSCGDTCQIWMWFKGSNSYICKIENVAYGEINSNHQPHHCLLNRLFRRRSKETSNLRVTVLCAGNSPGTGEFPAQMANYAENVSIWWRHHVVRHSLPNYQYMFSLVRLWFLTTLILHTCCKTQLMTNSCESMTMPPRNPAQIDPTSEANYHFAVKTFVNFAIQ